MSASHNPIFVSLHYFLGPFLFLFYSFFLNLLPFNSYFYWMVIRFYTFFHSHSCYLFLSLLRSLPHNPLAPNKVQSPHLSLNPFHFLFPLRSPPISLTSKVTAYYYNALFRSFYPFSHNLIILFSFIPHVRFPKTISSLPSPMLQLSPHPFHLLFTLPQFLSFF